VIHGHLIIISNHFVMRGNNFIILVFCIQVVLFLPNNSSIAQSPGSILENELRTFSADPALKNASWGFMVADVKTGREIVAINPDLSLIPASTHKVITTLTSLALLGSDYRFETLLQYTGTIKGNRLQGDIIIKGNGDPALGSIQMNDSLALDKVFALWAKALKDAGIRKIEGNVIADGSAFDDHMIPPKWYWEDMGNYYGAGAHALTANENMYTVFFNPGNLEGSPARVVKTEPEILGMDYINHVTTGPRRSGDRVYIYGAPYGNIRWLTGTVPLGENNFGVRGSIPDPGFFVAHAFYKYLDANGINVEGQPVTHRIAKELPAAESRIVLSRWYSPQLINIAARTNLNSVNTFAENLIKNLGKEILNEGSFSKGSEVTTAFWSEKGIDTDGMRIHDGSGLSAFNNVTARQLTGMLMFAAADESLYSSLIEGFPVAGRTGTLSGLFRNTTSEGVLMAKSGFLSNVRSYIGYTQCRNGNLIAFTLIVNNYSGSAIDMRNKMVRLMDAITRSAF
jgi:serine-type D-Ala-D-Ala carboxypeptidase/endopeptidase (penicillin-binding protein 4)